MLSTANITMQFSAKPLFENISVKFEEGARYGLIGANGAGKSTFMKILSRTLEPSGGNVSCGTHERISTLSQDQFAYEDCTVIDTVMMGHPELWKIGKERDRIYNLPEMSEEDGNKVADLEIQFADLDGYTAESRAAELLMGVDIPENAHAKKMSELAPALKLRVLLTQVLFSNPDVMLLDEPTNNLDLHTIDWLESELTKRDCSMIIISHDRHFLNSVCTHMADLDYGELRLFPGNYDEYMIAATASRDTLLANNARKKDKIAELQTFVSRFSANASKAKQATSRQKQIDKLILDEVKPSSRINPYIKFEPGRKLHRQALEVIKLTGGYNKDEPLFSGTNFLIDAGERIAIVGASGIGKTALVRTLIQDLPLLGGTVKWAENAKIGYLAQDHGDTFEADVSLSDWMTQWARPEDDEQVIRGILGRMLFSGDTIKKSVTKTSGGEKMRLLLGKLILTKPNVLMLDEPTNHLDMESIESLNNALEAFEGTLFFASHDRELIASVATQIIEIKPGGKVTHYRGNYEDYIKTTSS